MKYETWTAKVGDLEVIVFSCRGTESLFLCVKRTKWRNKRNTLIAIVMIAVWAHQHQIRPPLSQRNGIVVQTRQNQYEPVLSSELTGDRSTLCDDWQDRAAHRRLLTSWWRLFKHLQHLIAEQCPLFRSANLQRQHHFTFTGKNVDFPHKLDCIHRKGATRESKWRIILHFHTVEFDEAYLWAQKITCTVILG